MTVGVVVVHGIGDPKPGETVDALVQNLCGVDRSMHLVASARRVATVPQITWGVGGAPVEPSVVVPQRQLEHRATGTTILLSEVFWGDIGKVGGGRWGLFTALGSLAMGLHALIFAGGGVRPRSENIGVPCERQSRPFPDFATAGRGVRWLFWTALVGAYHIKGVLTPLAAAIYVLAALSWAWPTGAPRSVWVLALLPMMAWLAFVVPRRSQGGGEPATTGGQPRDTWVMPTVAAGCWCVAGYVVPVSALGPWTHSASDGIVIGLVYSVAFAFGHLCVIVGSHRCQWWSGWRRQLKRVAFAGAAIPWLTLLLWPGRAGDTSSPLAHVGPLLLAAYHAALALAAAWVVVVGGCWLWSSVSTAPENRPRHRVMFLGYALELSLWLLIASILGIAASELKPADKLAWLGLAGAYGVGAPLRFLPAVFVVGAALCALFWIRWRRQGRRVPSVEPPGIRELVESWMLPMLATTTAIASLVAMAVMVTRGVRLAPDDVTGWLDFVAIAAFSLLLAIDRAFSAALRHGLDLATDVTLYFRGRSWAAQPSHAADDILKRRFTTVADDLIGTGIDRLVVVAHSQGTVIAVDALRERPSTPNLRPDLITMGSPLDSLYARFFPGQFDGVITQVRAGVTGWLNVFRADDEVGRRLGSGVTDLPIAGSGHVGYWSDPEVARVLVPRIVR
jgi:hypothetical protein